MPFEDAPVLAISQGGAVGEGTEACDAQMAVEIRLARPHGIGPRAQARGPGRLAGDLVGVDDFLRDACRDHPFEQVVDKMLYHHLPETERRRGRVAGRIEHFTFARSRTTGTILRHLGR